MKKLLIILFLAVFASQLDAAICTNGKLICRAKADRDTVDVEDIPYDSLS